MNQYIFERNLSTLAHSFSYPFHFYSSTDLDVRNFLFHGVWWWMHSAEISMISVTIRQLTVRGILTNSRFSIFKLRFQICNLINGLCFFSHQEAHVLHTDTQWSPCVTDLCHHTILMIFRGGICFIGFIVHHKNYFIKLLI